MSRSSPLECDELLQQQLYILQQSVHSLVADAVSERPDAVGDGVLAAREAMQRLEKLHNDKMRLEANKRECVE